MRVKLIGVSANARKSEPLQAARTATPFPQCNSKSLARTEATSLEESFPFGPQMGAREPPQTLAQKLAYQISPSRRGIRRGCACRMHSLDPRLVERVEHKGLLHQQVDVFEVYILWCANALRSSLNLSAFFHNGILLGTVTFFAITTSVRYLQPMSLLTILTLALLAKALTEGRPGPASVARS
jgi:hypothetical protein